MQQQDQLFLLERPRKAFFDALMAGLIDSYSPFFSGLNKTGAFHLFLPFRPLCETGDCFAWDARSWNRSCALSCCFAL